MDPFSFDAAALLADPPQEPHESQQHHPQWAADFLAGLGIEDPAKPGIEAFLAQFDPVTGAGLAAVAAGDASADVASLAADPSWASLPPLDLDALLLPSTGALDDVPELEPTTPAATPAPAAAITIPMAAAPAPPVMEATYLLSAVCPPRPASTTLIPTATRKSASKCRSMPAVLEYPQGLIPVDAPILPRRGAPAPAEPKVPPAVVAALAKDVIKAGAPGSGTKRKLADLDHDDDDGDECPDLAGLDPKEAKRIKNTLSARKSRARRQAKLNYLEDRVNELEGENARLQAQVQQLTLQLVQQQQRQLEAVQRGGGAASVPAMFL